MTELIQREPRALAPVISPEDLISNAITAGMVGEWWSQAEAQATREGTRPALAYRADRQPWRVALRLGDLIPSLPHWPGPEWLVHVSLPAFAAINRESLKEL